MYTVFTVLSAIITGTAVCLLLQIKRTNKFCKEHEQFKDTVYENFTILLKDLDDQGRLSEEYKRKIWLNGGPLL